MQVVNTLDIYLSQSIRSKYKFFITYDNISSYICETLYFRSFNLLYR